MSGFRKVLKHPTTRKVVAGAIVATGITVAAHMGNPKRAQIAKKANKEQVARRSIKRIYGDNLASAISAGEIGNHFEASQGYFAAFEVAVNQKNWKSLGITNKQSAIEILNLSADSFVRHSQSIDPKRMNREQVIQLARFGRKLRRTVEEYGGMDKKKQHLLKQSVYQLNDRIYQ